MILSTNKINYSKNNMFAAYDSLMLNAVKKMSCKKYVVKQYVLRNKRLLCKEL